MKNLMSFFSRFKTTRKREYAYKARIEEKLHLLMDCQQIYLKDVNICDLAREIGTNRSYLSAFINKKMGMSYPRYLSEKRAFYAREKIEYYVSRSDKFTISDIAVMSGFGSLKALNRAFISNFGISPLNFRKRLESLMRHPSLPE